MADGAVSLFLRILTETPPVRDVPSLPDGTQR